MKKETSKAIGACIGASTISIVKLHRTDGATQIKDVYVQEHKGDPKSVFSHLLQKCSPEGYSIGVTGRKFRDIVTLPKITEPEAVEYSLKYLFTPEEYPSALVSAGSESFLVYTIDTFGKVTTITAGNKCASGTGEFFLQQIRRMNLEPEEAIEQAQCGEPYQVSGRCSVFCKSDCTHALNKGIPVSRVTAGLCKMIAKKIIELLAKVPTNRVVIVGGMAHNPVVIKHIVEKIPSVHVPEESFYFEALGSALWAVDRKDAVYNKQTAIFNKGHTSFSHQKPLSNFAHLVDFKTMSRGKAQKNDRCIIGLDVGSTTTKAVILRTDDNTILADEYLRTNGDPVSASRECYRSLLKQVPFELNIVGLGVTGSGRQIAGLYSLTDGVINEIIAHASAAAYFDPDVDTIFEIGGQDAKYTYLVNQVPCDYAMNEACSAGTGSFLEESAYESLHIPLEEIASIALKAKNPLNFSDQCAAFISSDIKTALQEGSTREDIVAGLVYSICINYNNRVKGNRSVGSKIFFQGGVCYNRAIPLAMAGLLGREIIVPPDPGLMGAFGVALEVKKRIELNILPEKTFSLKTLVDRTITQEKSFVCKGGAEKCDRACSINMYTIEGKKYPFGGACNKYYNLLHHLKYDVEKLDYVARRYTMVFNTFADTATAKSDGKTPLRIGMNKSLLNHTLYPLFHTFFAELGCEIVLSETVHESGIERATTSFCFPAQLALGLFEDLLQKEPDYIFLPHIIEVHVTEEKKYRQEFQTTCMMTQGEPFYLQASFKERTVNGKPLSDIVLCPTLNLASGYDAEQKKYITVAAKLGFSKAAAKRAHTRAVQKQMAFFDAMKAQGRQLLDELKQHPERNAMVLFGRSYNAFSPYANKGIPYKFASRGIAIIPYDFLLYESIPNWKNQYWEVGQRLVRAAQLVRDHPQLFGVYMTNFICAPDSMVIQHFRDIMGRKPSLTLEIDEHTADAGINTRIDAVLDIINNYQQIQKTVSSGHDMEDSFRPAQVVMKDLKIRYLDSDGELVKLTDPSVKVIIPAMSRLAAQGMASVFKSLGTNAEALPDFDTEAFRLAMTYHTGKECIPLIILSGHLMLYMKYRKNPDERLAYFVVGSGGNCRVGQYNIFLKRLIEKKRWRNVATIALNNENSYAGMGIRFRKLIWTIMLIADIMRDMQWVIKSAAVDPEPSLSLFYEEWNKIRNACEQNRGRNLLKQLQQSMKTLGKEIKLKQPLDQLKYIGVLGEIYVRHDPFALQGIVDRLAERGFTAKTAPIHEWLLYMDYCIKKGYQDPEYTLKGRLEASFAYLWQRQRERTVKRICATSGLCKEEPIDIDYYIRHSTHIVPAHLKGEPGLSSGHALALTIDKYCGIINIGPFGCMNSRLLQAVLAPEMNVAGKKRAVKQAGEPYRWEGSYHDKEHLPLFTIETDGNPFPQIVEAQFENFCIQAGRLHEKMMQVNGK